MTTEDDNRPARRRITLTGISSRAWEHPADRGALTALRELRGFDDVVKAFFGMWNERGFRLQFLAGAIRVDHRQYPRVYQRFTEAARTLDVPEPPELYVHQSPMISGQSIGLDRPFVVISTAAVDKLDDEELRTLLGREIGHVRSGHAVYQTILTILTRWVTNISWIPMGALALRAVIVAMYEWWRKAELSADRAGLLAAQDQGASIRLFMKMAGGGDLSQIDTAAFLEQAAEYRGGGDLRDSFHKIGMTAWSSYPVPVARAAELQQWVDSGAYGRIIAGDYPRRDDDRDARATEDIKAAASSYRETFQNPAGPLVSLVRRSRGGPGGGGGGGGPQGGPPPPRGGPRRGGGESRRPPRRPARRPAGRQPQLSPGPPGAAGPLPPGARP